VTILRNATLQGLVKTTDCAIFSFQGSSATRNSIEKQDTEDNRPLCRFANKGTCREKSPECKYRHQRCKSYESCSNLNCELAHAKKQTVLESHSSTSGSISSLSSDAEEYGRNVYYPTSVRQSINTSSKPCHNGIKCFKMRCQFLHPDGWTPCHYGVRCKNYYCKANHPFQRRATCRDGDQCKISNCKFLHPIPRPEECPLRAMCKKWDCPQLHPYSRVRPYNKNEACTNPDCSLLERDNLLCSIEARSVIATTNPHDFVALLCVFFFFFFSFSIYLFNIVSIFSLIMYYIFFSFICL